MLPEAAHQAPAAASASDPRAARSRYRTAAGNVSWAGSRLPVQQSLRARVQRQHEIARLIECGENQRVVPIEQAAHVREPQRAAVAILVAAPQELDERPH